MTHRIGRAHRVRRMAGAAGLAVLLPLTVAACAEDEPNEDEIVEEEPLEDEEGE